MEPVSAIRTLGFKRWFERQLIESHAYLVTLVLCLVLVFALFEQLGSSGGRFERALIYGAILGGSALGIVSWKQYVVILFRALRLSEHSTCEKCGAYARFSVLDAARRNPEDVETSRNGLWLKLKCKACGHEWMMG